MTAIGDRFGRLVVVKRAPPRGARRQYMFWLCRCDCGGTKEVRAENLRDGTTKSCGCLRREAVAERNRQRIREGAR